MRRHDRYRIARGKTGFQRLIELTLDFLAPLKTSKPLQAAHAVIRAVCPAMEKDRVMYQDFARIADVIAAGKLAGLVR